MNKKELINRVVDVLKDNDVRKHIAAQKTVLHISDDSGNVSDFLIKKPERGLLFTNGDITEIINACIEVVEDAMKHGEEVYIHGFGSLSLNHRAATVTRHPDTGEVLNIDAHYVPKFSAGHDLKMAAKIYELSLEERGGEK